MYENKNHCKSLNTILKIKYNNIKRRKLLFIYKYKHNKENFDNNFNILRQNYESSLGRILYEYKKIINCYAFYTYK